MKLFNLGPPTSEDSIVELLKPKLKNYELIKEFKKFRNFLGHQYIKVDYEKILKYLTHFQEDTLKITTEFKDIID